MFFAKKTPLTHVKGIKKCHRVGSNHRPSAYETLALTN